ncbi:hypothetical protein LX15_001777 [Streptoalloteichus tenebrarius]|uniref:Transposase n=1 Tax=Streptoalloteichus tenebrarius (strain ATCC 17920 / DSM 40477 / JCM 4838 / CBS 697.72 / NBRC 16177 / NCIMB 11028 / NRRL B-12390 / A12253. 1 / ISP 5477) TaxID=1933 RepID=A0ABT1HRD4_STRSD|nr:hypothetical protein [Streptoalloteichus tenebrarius]MCP2258090.1 hypothetical protein [Streptoalloteichus tenebrarius]BFF01763.1 hypothetical protein GCM10020241_34380 [Streptoalloteichus tenebrarius]
MKKIDYVFPSPKWGPLAREWRTSLGFGDKSLDTVRVHLQRRRLLGEGALSGTEGAAQ